ncbi:MAG TPA: protease modulator HflC [Acetobacteraceae bacterium]|nr:protease modulator HflC [Acetobacteraceae bacterium]
MRRFSLAVVAVIALIVVVGVLGGLYTVRQTEEALITQFGKPVAVITAPGLHFKAPFVQTAILFDKRLQTDAFPAEELILGDQKRLIVDGFVEYQIVNPLAYYQSVGPSQDAILQRLDAVVSAAVRNELAGVDMVTVLSSARTHILERILANVRTGMDGFGVQVVDVRLTRTNLPVQNTEAVLARMRSERERVAAELRATGDEQSLTIRADADRQRTVLLADAQAQGSALRGEGEAEAIGIYAKAIERDPRFYGIWRTLEAYREGLAKPGNRLVLSPSSPLLHYLEAAPVAGAAPPNPPSQP